ncbi:MAG TPA: hypothetical protein VHB48_21265 [Chitinophagaceae bacterium]|nr:hypothetical protein [Chitinophagaceae bacterium]
MTATNQNTTAIPAKASQRLLSLDFLRGLIMVFLAVESTGIYGYLNQSAEGTPFSFITIQFEHHPWNGLRFWDLIQPSFMFMAGISMALSLNKQWSNGVTWSQSFKKTLKRCGWLFFWGVLDYAVRPGGLSFELWDVLTQLSFTTLVAFLIFRWSAAAQIVMCAALLLLTEALYRFTNVPGFNQPFVDQHNFGNYVDTVLMNRINSGGWVAINCIPTAVHTIAGALVGKLLLSAKNKIQPLLLWGTGCLIIGFGMDYLQITPIIKRIATTSFTIASLGWVLLFLALAYWWVDIKNHRKHLLFFTVVGMNSLFIYLFFEIVGDRWFTGYISFIATGVTSWVTGNGMIQHLIAAASVFGLEWYLCYFLYRHKIYFRL